ncbi:MAG TPA: hypothetical protein VM074_12005 [Solimonas sp.]|nr:hypothetical protein [Solimonas sp.]
MKGRMAFLALVAVGTLQMAGDLAGVPALKAIGAATGASPAPKVFTNQNGIETFSARFFLDWTDLDGTPHATEITPHNYAGMRGPYNRRNTYGAAVAGAPWLSTGDYTAPLWASATHYALCGPAPLLRELGLDPAQMQGSPRLRLVPRVAPDDPAKDWPLEFKMNCHD